MAQLVARQTEDLKVASSILAESINCFMVNLLTCMLDDSCNPHTTSICYLHRGISSNGRARALHARGRGIDTLILHHVVVFRTIGE